MAATNLTVNKMLDWDTFMTAVNTASLFEAVDATDGALFEMSARDDKYIIIAQNANASSTKAVTIKAGDGLQAGMGDMTVNLAAGKTTAIQINSMRFKNLSGTNKNKVMITGGSADIKIAVFKLP